MAEPFSNIAIVIGAGVTNKRVISSGSATINTGGVNMAPIGGDLTIAGGVNEAAGTVAGNVTISSGTNNANVTGNVTMTGGTIASTAYIGGNITISGGTNSAIVAGNATITGGTNNARVGGNIVVSGSGVQGGTIVGNARLEGGSLSSGASVRGNLIVSSTAAGNTVPIGPITVGGNILLGAGIDPAPLLNLVSNYVGTVVSRGQGDALVTTQYTLVEGTSTAGAPAPASGVYYNLENDGKAYNYESGGKTAINGGYFNLTGDNKAYTWASGVKGALYTGTIGGTSYVDGVAQAPVDYIAWTVTNDNNTVTDHTLYTAANGNVSTSDVFIDSALETLYTGVYSYDSVNYAVNDGADYTGAVLFSSEYFSATSRVISTDKATGISQPLGSTLYRYFPGDGTGVLFTGAWYDSSSDVYRTVTDGVRDTNGANRVLQLDSDLKYYTFFGGTIGSAFNGVAFVGLDGKYHHISGGAVGALFTGAWYDSSSDVYRTVTDGVRDTNGANGVLQLDSDLKYYTFSGGTFVSAFNGVAFVGLDGKYHHISSGSVESLFTGAWYDGGVYRTVTDGVRDTNGANGVLQLDSDLKYYTFSGGTIGSAFNGGAFEIGGSWYSVMAGVRETSATFNGVSFYSNDYRIVTNGAPAWDAASGVRMLDSDGLCYNFSGGGALFTGIANVFNNRYYNIDAGVLGTLFDGAVNIDGTHRSVTAGVVYNNASGVLKLANDSLYHNFPGDGSAGELLNGIVESALSSGVHSIYKDGAYYFSGTVAGSYPSLCNNVTNNFLWIAYEGLNIHDKVMSVGTGYSTGSYVVYEKPGAKTGQFADQGFKYVFTDGKIGNVSTCGGYGND